MAEELRPVSGDEPREGRRTAKPLIDQSRLPWRRIAPTARQIRSDRPLRSLSLSSPHDGHLLHLAIEALPACELWQGERPITIDPCPAGFLQLFDLRQPAALDIPHRHHILQIHLPNAVLRDCAQREGRPFGGRLHCELVVCHDDPVVRHLGLAIIAASETGGKTQGLVLDPVLRAVAQHVARRYGEPVPHRSPKGTLALWQERRAKELMEANLAAGVTLSQLAEACRLSITHFSRAFRRSTGTSPHRWLRDRRLERAMSMLGSGQVSLVAIAQACGFADQSHFTRIFTQTVGISPGQWRRRYCP